MLQWEVHFYPWRQKDPFRGLYVREWPMKIGSAMENGCRGRERGGESRNQSELWEVLLEGPCCMLNRFSHVWLSDPMDCSSPGSSVHGILQTDTGVGCHVLLQGIFPTQGSNLHLFCLLHWQVVSLLLAPPGKPSIGVSQGEMMKAWFKGRYAE